MDNPNPDIILWIAIESRSLLVELTFLFLIPYYPLPETV